MRGQHRALESDVYVSPRLRSRIKRGGDRFCDIEPDGQHHDFNSWLGNGMGNRYEQVPGQVDRLWVLDVKGQRLVVDATYAPDTTPADRSELSRVVESLRFGS